MSTSADVDAVLRGDRSYDFVSARDQEEVRVRWAADFDRRIESIDLSGRFIAEGRPFVELDSDGQLAIRRPR
ncbi:hypothetical protein [uncultured Williamsia sp.]|uniref:hypothetical protein n=1 Tax=uncultured Williamsia sp. TaxID=259311 RepID=UPI00261A9A82|nr:hypothetical protein [uncultured Williamsia sp.]